jgi:hypothetical protein
MIFSLHQMLLGISCLGRQTVGTCGVCGRAGKIVYISGLETREEKSSLE